MKLSIPQKIKCPVCHKMVDIDDLMMGYKVIAIYNGHKSHGGVACKKCIAKEKK